MRDLAEVIGILGVIIMLIVVVVLIVSLPFAFIGWIMLVVVNFFGTVAITYFNSVMMGLCVSILGAVLSKF